MHTPIAVLLIDGGLQKVLGVWDVEELRTQSVVIHYHHPCCFHSTCLVCILDRSVYTKFLSANHPKVHHRGYFPLLEIPGSFLLLLWCSVASERMWHSREDKEMFLMLHKKVQIRNYTTCS